MTGGDVVDALSSRTVRRAVALTLATLHHGLANLNSGSTTPARKETVTDTAETFSDWLSAKGSR